MDVSNSPRARLDDFWGGKMHKHLHQRWPLCPCQVAFTFVHSDGDISLLRRGSALIENGTLDSQNIAPWSQIKLKKLGISRMQKGIFAAS